MHLSFKFRVRWHALHKSICRVPAYGSENSPQNHTPLHRNIFTWCRRRSELWTAITPEISADINLGRRHPRFAPVALHPRICGVEASARDAPRPEFERAKSQPTSDSSLLTYMFIPFDTSRCHVFLVSVLMNMFCYFSYSETHVLFLLPLICISNYFRSLSVFGFVTYRFYLLSSHHIPKNDWKSKC